VYVYFLIFAQFAFIARLAELGIAATALKVVMAAMAAGGILVSLVTPRVRIAQDPALRLRIGFAVSAIAAILTLARFDVAQAAVVAFLVGAGLGVTTVTLVTHLRDWVGERRGAVYAGLGTGIGYLVCNVPAVFTATPRMQAVLAAALCSLAIALPLGGSNCGENVAARQRTRMPFLVALPAFAALIWLDSAAFYIIQHTDALKAGTWSGSAHLWVNGALHFAAAIGAGVLLQRGRASATLALAFAALGFACILLRDPALILSGSLFYPIGVSLYSVALVVYPSFLARADSAEERGRQAGWIYAVAGWMGSALGIGMGQNVGHVPIAFVAVTAVVVLGPMCVAIARRRSREFVLVGATAAFAFFVYRAYPGKPTPTLTQAERGRQVYISEGCISCHSQYVRPNSPDVLMWGPVETLEEIHRQKPPLIGNRRQGPDLAEVGFRRSPLWLRAHLIDPAEVSYHSPMPPYAILFRDGRGDELVAYLESLRGPAVQGQLERQAAWEPAATAWSSYSNAEGEANYVKHCAACHDEHGATRERWKTQWRKLPDDLSGLRSFAANQSRTRLAQIAKFGIQSTDMPGHEYLNDRQIASITMWIKPTAQQDVSLTK
jgi:cytochrome c oxidase cbb3-type subunit 2